jgi:hypothetical protein
MFAPSILVVINYKRKHEFERIQTTSKASLIAAMIQFFGVIQFMSHRTAVDAIVAIRTALKPQTLPADVTYRCLSSYWDLSAGRWRDFHNFSIYNKPKRAFVHLVS